MTEDVRLWPTLAGKIADESFAKSSPRRPASERRKRREHGRDRSRAAWSGVTKEEAKPLMGQTFRKGRFWVGACGVSGCIPRRDMGKRTHPRQSERVRDLVYGTRFNNESGDDVPRDIPVT